MACALLRLDSLKLLALGRIKDIVYRNTSQTINELKTKIREEIRVINEDALKRVFKNMNTRLNFVISEDGGHLELLMN